METKIIVTKISHDDIVNILSTALYGCDCFEADYNRNIWSKIPEDRKEGNCYEDHLADMLLNGSSISVTDHYAEGMIYTGHKDESLIEMDKDGNATYYLTLEDFLWACSTEKGYELAREIISGEGDYFTGNNLLQIAMFGEVIYG